jgi:hypothetical protein
VQDALAAERRGGAARAAMIASLEEELAATQARLREAELSSVRAVGAGRATAREREDEKQQEKKCRQKEEAPAKVVKPSWAARAAAQATAAAEAAKAAAVDQARKEGAATARAAGGEQPIA